MSIVNIIFFILEFNNQSFLIKLKSNLFAQAENTLFDLLLKQILSVRKSF